MVGLLALLALGTLIHGLILAQQLNGHPLARVPLVDADVYWDWAGLIARGQWQGESPFFSAPLYPYLLGTLRALGGELNAVYLVQLLMHLGTATLVWFVGRARFGPRVGLIATALWLLSTGPAYANLRVLAGPLQALLVTATLALTVRYQEHSTRGRALLMGLAAGLTCLAWPPALGAVAVLCLWVVWWAGGRRGLGHAAAFLTAAVLTVSPATVHNYRAGGEFIPITAHAGITLYHGNNPSADGTFSPLGVSGDKRVHGRDAYEQAATALGRETIGWKEVSAYFSGRAMDWWRENPGRALTVTALKGWLFLSSSVHGEIYVPALERADSSSSRLGLAPISVRLLALPALLAGILLLFRDPRRHLPEVLILGLALAVCVVFFYSPRYRLPAVPVMAILAGWALSGLGGVMRGEWRPTLLMFAFGVSASGAWINVLLDLDRPQPYQAEYELRLGRAHLKLGEADQARPHLQAARDLGHPHAALELVRISLDADPDHPEGALAELKRLAAERSTDGAVQSAYALALARTGQPAEALIFYLRAISLDSNDVDAELGAGSCLVQLDQPEQALVHFDRVLELDEVGGDVHFNRGVALEALERSEEARVAYEQELMGDPGHDLARGALVSLLQRMGLHAEAIRNARAMLDKDPDHVGARLVLGWILATSPDGSLHDGLEAVRLVEPLATGPGAEDPFVLDTLAAAHARAGQWDQAQDVQRRAVEILATHGGGEDGAMLEEMRARLESYLRQVPFQERR